MSRPIKFRAWDNKISAYVIPAHTMNIHTGQISDIPERFILEQFTGLYDKNGKEIYEGDRLRWIAYGCPMDEYEELSETYELIVKWVCGGFDVPYEDDTENCYEVIGNIHEATK